MRGTRNGLYTRTRTHTQTQLTKYMGKFIYIELLYNAERSEAKKIVPSEARQAYSYSYSR